MDIIKDPPSRIPKASLLLANLVPVIGVVFLNWTIASVIVLYWLENFVVGFFNILKMSKIKNTNLFQNNKSQHVAKIIVPVLSPKVIIFIKAFFIIFFILHFGFFTFGHGQFVLIFFGFPSPIIALFIPLMFLFISHGISYIVNFIGKKEYEKVSLIRQMMMPYSRLFVMHITIMIGGIITLFLYAPLTDMTKFDSSALSNMPQIYQIPALLVLIGAKIYIDLMSHSYEHAYRYFTRIKTKKITVNKKIV